MGFPSNLLGGFDMARAQAYHAVAARREIVIVRDQHQRGASLLASWVGAVEPQAVRVVLGTELGEIELAIDVGRAPVTAANFLRYVDGGYYDGGRFHRTVLPDNQPQSPVKIEVIQAGARPEARGRVGASPGPFPPIPLERTSKTGLRHVDGAASRARLGPDTAQDEFFICIGDQPELDFGGRRNPDGQGFAAFGRVVRGMDVVRKIQRAARQEQALTPPIPILKARRVGAKSPPGSR